MKSFILAMGFLFTVTSQANTIESAFKSDSVVPKELQVRILESVTTQCGELVTQYGLSEIITKVREDKVDQGMVDYFYETTFKSRYYPDGMHPGSTYLTVESAKYDIDNGDNLAILNVLCE